MNAIETILIANQPFWITNILIAEARIKRIGQSVQYVR